MNGTEAIKTIREIERQKGVEGTQNEAIIVIVSAVDDRTTIINACYSSGANYYFIKPLDLNQMKRQMIKLELID